MKITKKQILVVMSVTVLFFTGFTQIKTIEMVRESNFKKKEMSMKRVKAEVYIDAPINKVWAIVGKNFDENSKFSLEAKKTYYLKKVDGMVGSQRRTVNHKDKVIDVEVIEYDPKKNHVKWEIYNMNVAPLKAGNSSYTLRAHSSGGTILEQKAAFKMKIFFMDWVAKGKFTTLFKTQLAAIKHLAETDEIITPQTKDEIVERYADAINVIK
ncbi:SRPBCC family protein [Muriicola sp. Z0-33]|uniref:SRPBCC family protein n=1 Tax=Muriicola sp. Z0-33 TaxID=2816957 RepID=UPI002238C85A|nr:SRPBCC family protein [Muriicola sp. Z0-33]MCW5516933.1 SRPBCC family protein [Muriicola sp. Z0-33]